MKQPLLLTAFGLAMGLTAQALVVTPDSFSVDFNDYMSVPDTWTTYGVDGVPTGSYDYLFKDYSAENPFILLELNGNFVPFTPTQFKDGQAGDQWLITPEFEIEREEELLAFTVYVSGTSSKSSYKVLLSAGGDSKEDFTETLLSTTLSGQMSSVASATRRIVVKGHAGEKVRLAFVSAGNVTGIAGFADISMGPYYINVENPASLEQRIIDADDPTFSFKMKVATTSKVGGLTAILECDNGYEDTFEYAGNLTSGMFTTISPRFDDIDFKGASQTGYTVRMRPNVPGFPETVVSGVLVKAPRTYPSNVVSEEGTGTWCGWCPYGTAMMGYYEDVYDGAAGGKFIPVAVHYGDPMDVEAYSVPWQLAASKLMAGFGYPTIMANRAIAAHPLTVDIAGLMQRKSFADLYISRVEVDETERNIYVNYHPRISFSADDMALNAAVIVMENGVKGTGSQWAQTNNLHDFTASDVTGELGEELLPYFEPFIDRPGTTVPASEMVYNDVARAIYPSFAGEPLEGGWQQDARRDEVAVLPIPANVTDTSKMGIVVIMTDPASGEIVASDWVKAEDFGKELSGIEGLHASGEGVTLYRSGNVAVADIAGKGSLTVCALDGTLLRSAELAEGRNEIEIPQGVAIIKVATSEGTAILKTIR